MCDTMEEEREIDIIMVKKEWYLAKSNLEYYVFKKGYETIIFIHIGLDSSNRQEDGIYYKFDNYEDALSQFNGLCGE